MADLFQQAVAAYKAGDSKQARAHLMSLIKSNPQHENAWLMLSQLVASPEKREQCLRQVLQLNPKNKIAQQELAKLSGEALPPDEMPSLDMIMEADPTYPPEEPEPSYIVAEEAEPAYLVDEVDAPAPPRQASPRKPGVHPRIYLPTEYKKPKDPPKVPALKPVEPGPITQAKFSLKGVIRKLLAKIRQIRLEIETKFDALHKREKFWDRVRGAAFCLLFVVMFGGFGVVFGSMVLFNIDEDDMGGLIAPLVFGGFAAFGLMFASQIVVWFFKRGITKQKGGVDEAGRTQPALTEDVLTKFKDDVALKREVLAKLDFSTAEQEEKKLRETRSPSGWPKRYYKDEWLMTRLRLLDQNKLKIRFINRFKIKYARRTSPSWWRYQLKIGLKLDPSKTLPADTDWLQSHLPWQSVDFFIVTHQGNKVKIKAEKFKPFTPEDVVRILQGLYRGLESL